MEIKLLISLVIGLTRFIKMEEIISEPCIGIPSYEELESLHCLGWEVEEFPILNHNQKITLERIYIIDTLISYLPLMNSTSYPNLTNFEEIQNIILPCQDVINWMIHQPNTEFITKCEFISTSTKVMSTTSYPLTSSEGIITNISTTPIITSPTPTTSNHTSTTWNENITSDQIITSDPSPTKETNECATSCLQMITTCSTMFIITLIINIFNAIYYGMQLRKISHAMKITSTKRETYATAFSNPNFTGLEPTQPGPSSPQTSGEGPIYINPADMISHGKEKHRSSKNHGIRSKNKTRRDDVTLEMAPMSTRDASSPQVSKKKGGAKTPEGDYKNNSN